MNQDLIEAEMIRTAVYHLQYGTGTNPKAHRILYPEDATVEFPEFNPERAAQVIAFVSIPAIIHGSERVLTHAIYDGDTIH